MLCRKLIHHPYLLQLKHIISLSSMAVTITHQCHAKSGQLRYNPRLSCLKTTVFCRSSSFDSVNSNPNIKTDMVRQSSDNVLARLPNPHPRRWSRWPYDSAGPNQVRLDEPSSYHYDL